MKALSLPKLQFPSAIALSDLVHSLRLWVADRAEFRRPVGIPDRKVKRNFPKPKTPGSSLPKHRLRGG